MFRWPVEFTPLSLGSNGFPREAILEVTPRGAAFTLAALSHIGHPAHLALVDAYLKGQVRLTPTATIGDDSRIVASSLAVPLLAAHELGMERIVLSDLVLLPRSLSQDEDGRQDWWLWPGRGPDSPRYLLRAPQAWVWVRAADRFELAGCAGTQGGGVGSTWYDAIAELPFDPDDCNVFVGNHGLPPIRAELRQATEAHPASDRLVRALRAMAHARFARVTISGRRAAEEAAQEIETALKGTSPLNVEELRAERCVVLPEHRVGDPAELADMLSTVIKDQRMAAATLSWRGLEVDVILRPELDGYQTLCLLPPADADPSALFEAMLDLAWETIEILIGRSLTERRTEPIVLRLIAEDGRSTTLDVGASVVIGRNQTVFTAWVGSDGRVMLKLFPPGGMTAR